MSETGPVVEVYVDVVILVNFLMDYLILWATGKLGGVRMKKRRLALAAGTGALYTLVIFLPAYSLYTTMAAKIACSLAMAAIAFAPLKRGVFIRLLGYFYLTTFAMGGAVFGAVWLFSGTGGMILTRNGAALLPGNFQYYWLAAALAAALFLGNGGMNWARKRGLEQDLTGTLVIGIGERKLSLEAFVDTGNQLSDPLSKKPVIVTEARTLRGFVPEELLAAAAAPRETRLLKPALPDDPRWVTRLRLINYEAVGTKSGLMVGLKVDYIEFITKQESIRAEDVVVGIMDGILAGKGKYQALIPPRLLKEYENKEATYAAAEGKAGGMEL
ncbi:MAG: sigma-E processing peptidase SpoIIGA [Clostridia bacterium]|nr:sigma-E processing peptidase SpoIIGA [Clostridia bacterium]